MLHLVSDDDLDFINHIRNDERNISLLNWSSWSPESKEDTLRYINKFSGSYYVITGDDQSKVGYVHVKNSNLGTGRHFSGLEVGIFIVPDARGLGYGARALAELEKFHQDSFCFVARVVIDNTPSLKLFTRSGYYQVGSIPVLSSSELIPTNLVILAKKI